MHKTILQELCHKRMWGLPAYTSGRDGPDHSPLFGASVVVNGQTFDAPSLFKSVKEAHNKAAEVALDHLSSIPPAPPALAHLDGDAPPPDTKPQTSYKNQLQQYVQKRNMGVLKYISVREGAAHALRFKARVTIDGQTFESSQYFSTLREAEHSAARVALMSLPLEENHQDEPNFYKNLIQELCQKECLSLPIYNTLCDGESHMPNFTSTVVLDGESFVGDAARTKKQAEMNAAKVAFNHVKGRINAHSMKLTNGKAIDRLEQTKIHTVPLSSLSTKERSQTAEGKDVCPAKIIKPATGLSLKYRVKHDDSPSSSKNQMVSVNVMNQPYLNSVPASTLKIKEEHQARSDTNVLEQHKGPVQISNVKIKEEKQANGKVEDNGVSNKTYHEVSVSTNASILMNEPDTDILSFDFTDKLDLLNLNLDSSASSLDFDGKTKQEESKDVSSEHIVAEAIKDIDADDHKIFDSPSLLCNRVLVYPRKPDIVLPAGTTLMPFSDGAWVAVSLDFSEHEDKLPTSL